MDRSSHAIVRICRKDRLGVKKGFFFLPPSICRRPACAMSRALASTRSGSPHHARQPHLVTPPPLPSCLCGSDSDTPIRRCGDNASNQGIVRSVRAAVGCLAFAPVTMDAYV